MGKVMFSVRGEGLSKDTRHSVKARKGNNRNSKIITRKDKRDRRENKYMYVMIKKKK